jgi:hypothetical protein
MTSRKQCFNSVDNELTSTGGILPVDLKLWFADCTQGLSSVFFCQEDFGASEVSVGEGTVQFADTKDHHPLGRLNL